MPRIKASSRASQIKIGVRIAELRKQGGMTQVEFAHKLGTSQSAVVRMEKGLQNFSAETLDKLSDVFNRDLITVPRGVVHFRIEGGYVLKGIIQTTTSHNSAVVLLYASLLNRGVTILKDVPMIEEVFRGIDILKALDVSVVWHATDLHIVRPPRLTFSKVTKEMINETRSSILLLGSLAGSLFSFTLPYTTSQKRLGLHSITAHVYAFHDFGVKIYATSLGFRVRVGRIRGGDVVLYEASDLATVNAVFLAVLSDTKTTIRFASANYQVQDVCFFLMGTGVKIEGIGTSTLIIYGKSDIRTSTQYFLGEDPVQAMLLLSAAIMTHSSITITRCPIDFLSLELLKLKKMGFKYEASPSYLSHNKHVRLVDIVTHSSELRALNDKIHALPYPGINIDNLPFFASIATQTRGKTLIHDWVFDNRAVSYSELNRLGAEVTLADQHRVFIDGPTPLYGGDVICPFSLRPASFLIVAMLGAKGISTLRNVHTINRGYEDVCMRLNSIGAKISVLRGL